jgi:hypothetical protein
MLARKHYLTSLPIDWHELPENPIELELLTLGYTYERRY